MDDLNRAVRDVWDRNAAYWDERMGEGNLFQRLLIGPATERLLAIRPGELVLDVACGNGVMARHLAQLGARVVACDLSANLIELARARGSPVSGAIDYQVVDATDRVQLLSLGERRFDAAVCNMALMDMAEIEPLFEALARLLKPRRPFVFSVMHPCFNTSATALTMEEEDRNGELVTTCSVRVFKYSDMQMTTGEAIRGQPVRQYYFHRPISTLFNACFRAGFVLDGMEEPTFDERARSERPLSWANFRGIPPALVARMLLDRTE